MPLFYLLDLYNRLKQGPNHPTLNALGIESLISQESEIEVSRLNKRVLHLEKENRDYLSKLSEKQSEYESIIQKNNLTSSELQTTKQELNRYQQKCESLSKILIDKDQRIQQLTTERTNMNMKIKDIELKNLEDKFKESQDLVITNLKAENELYKKILNSSKGGQLSSSSTDIAVIQKREIDLLRENDKLKQKIYSFKQMIKEYDILLSIFKEKSKDNEDNLAFKRLMALDDPQTEELMLKVRDQIEVCVHKLKQSFDVAYPRKTDESMNLMEQRISDLNTEKSNLLNLFSQQESSYKSTIELNHKEAFKLKETLRKTLESKSVLESKLKSTTASLESAVNQINSLKAQESSLISSFKEQIQEKDFQLHTNLSQSALQIDLLNCKINSLNSELSSESEKFNSTLLEISKNLKTQEDSVQVLTSRLKLKEEEIYELKSNYESQIDSLTSEESKVPIPSLRIFPSTPVSSSVPPPAAKIHDLQQKIHILTDKLFTAKDEIILLQTALEGEKAARSEQIQKLQETYEFSLKSEKEKMEEMVKKSGEEIKAEKQQEIGKLKADLNAMAKEMEVGKSRERNTGGERLKEAERKLKEQEERRGVENVRTMKMMAMLNKAKKLIDNKDKEIEELKKSAEGKD